MGRSGSGGVISMPGPGRTIVAVILLATGCYRYAPTALDDVPIGAEVRSILTPSGMARVQEADRSGGQELRFGPVIGQLIDRNGDWLMLSVRSALIQEGSGARELRQRLSFQRSEILQMELKQLDTRRTLLATGLVTLGVVAVLTGALGGETGGFGLPPGGRGPPELTGRTR